MGYQCFYGEAIAVETKATDHAETGGGEERLVTERLALMNIRDMNLDNGALQGADAVVERHTGVGIGTCIEHDAVTAFEEAYLLHLVDELALDIALEVGYLHIRKLSLQRRQVALKRLIAIDTRFALSQQIEVRTIDNLNLHTPYYI
jgi:hypothetical protein